jgi:hypothetical protein
VAVLANPKRRHCCRSISASTSSARHWPRIASRTSGWMSPRSTA